MSADTRPAVDVGRKFTRAASVGVPDTSSTRQELADARTVLAALQERPDWARQPGEVDQARALVKELAERHHAAEVASHEARTKARRAAYAPAITAANEHAARLAAEAPRLIGRLAELAAGLAQLIADTDDHREQVRQLDSQRLTVTETARRHREQSHLPQDRPARIADVPRGDVLAGPLLTLRNALKAAGGGPGQLEQQG